MFIQERLQAAIHQLELGFGARIIRWLLISVALVGMMVCYDTRVYHAFNSEEAMDAAQLARNLSEGHGYTTDFIRPFSLYLVKKHNQAAHPAEAASTNFVDTAQIYTAHPDLANAPLYPMVLAGIMKVWTPQWKVERHKPFWSEGGNFRRYQPEFRIAILNQLLLFAVVALTFQLTRKLFDGPAAWLATTITLGSALLWKFSVSGLPTMLLMVTFLTLAWCLVKIEEAGRAELPPVRSLFLFALMAGLLTGLGMLTRYSFGWLIVPVVIFLVLFGGSRRSGLAVAAVLAFGLVVSPWIVRNLSVSGTPFGTAGFAAAEGITGFSGSRLMQSINPDMTAVYWLRPYGHKLIDNLSNILQGDIFHLAGGWMGILFFAGLLLGLRNAAARRLRYFAVMCLGVFIFVQALGQTHVSVANPEVNTENVLVLLTPFVVIFGVAFFLTLLDQMNLPSLAIRRVVISLLVILATRGLLSTNITKEPTIAYPPYYPPDIQEISGWMRPDELIMSDVPWAVAWYGDRQCTWTTINSQYEFYALNDYVKPVHGLYLTLITLNGKLMTECIQGGVESWDNFVFKTLVANQLPSGFPLRYFPEETLMSGMFLTDRQRW
ncbi:MAG: glycosyltransferase family 39 protein [Verrucomicrobiae bacterium]|nr:glycosyltransferase family 39 protein [Verrucomicrobiae bacterium]